MAHDDVHVQLDLDELFDEFNRTVHVEAALTRRATAIAARARTIDAAEGGAASFSIDRRWLPNGRLMLRVVSNDPDGEYGTATTSRRRALRQAVGSR